VEFGPGKPDRAVAKYANQAEPDSWTVFGLRPLLSKSGNFGHVDREWGRLVLAMTYSCCIEEIPLREVTK
jgi:hypothetical protein